jgi:subtilase family serine protease
VTGRISLGGSQTVTIASAGKIALIVFDAAAGQRATISITGVTIASSTVTVYSPAAGVLTSMSVNSSGAALDIVFPFTGTYTILVAPAGTSTGSMTLTFAAETTPDLVPTALTAPSSASTQQGITVSWTVQNQGSGPAAGGSYDYLYISPTATCCTGATFLAQGGTSTVAAGASYTTTKSVTIPSLPAGSYYLIMWADIPNYLYESNEGNNQLAVPITITAVPPDLIPTALTGPASASTQQSISVAWTVQNTGAGATTASWQDNLYISPSSTCCAGATLLQAVTGLTGLAAGGSYTQPTTVTVPNLAAGSYYLIVWTDANNTQGETNEGNNQRATPITISTPDLLPTALSGPGSANAQQSISVSWTVQNQGTGATAASWQDNLYISPSSTCCTGATLLQTVTGLNGLSGSGTYTQAPTVTLPNLAPGSYYLIVSTDAAGTVYESDETNNQRSTAITINGPDLSPTALSGPASASTQQSISVSWTVKNQGTQPTAGTWNDTVYISPNSTCCAGATSLGQWSKSNLAAGASYSQTKTVIVAGVPAGSYYLIVSTDSGNALAESSETNNQRSVAITITTPDLAPTALTAPSSAAAGHSISVSWTVQNQGTAATVGSWNDALYISPSSTCCAGATSLGQWSKSNLAIGASYSQTKSVTVPSLSAGSYYLILWTDVTDQLYEANGANNQRVVPITVQ